MHLPFVFCAISLARLQTCTRATLSTRTETIKLVSAEVEHHRAQQSEIEKIRRSQLVSGPTPPMPPLSATDSATSTGTAPHNSALNTTTPISPSSNLASAAGATAQLGAAARRASPLRDTIDKLDMILNEIPQMERKVMIEPTALQFLEHTTTHSSATMTLRP